MPTTTGRATDFITFTRTSNATVTDSNGFIEWAGHNLLTNSESFDASGWIKQNLAATPVLANVEVAPNGTTTADKIVENTGTSSHSIATPITTPIAGAIYTFAIYCKPAGRSFVQVQIDMGGVNSRAICNLTTATFGTPTNTAGSATYTATALSNGWVLLTATATMLSATAGYNYFYPCSDATTFSYTGDGTSGLYLWGAHLYRSDLGGMVLNPARGDAYYPTTPRNLLGFTEDFSNAAWTKTRVKAFGSGSVSNAAVAPNGLQTADLIVEDTTASNTHFVSQTTSSLAASPHVYSVYAKAAGRSWIAVLIDNLAVWFNLSSGTKGTEESGVTGSITPIGDGWYRCTVFRTIASAGAKDCRVYLATADNSVTYTGDGTSGIYLWGAQLSDSASLDAYSPVYGAAVTSAAYYAPRLDYSGSSLAALGLLVEEQRTNLLLRSNEFNISWVAAGTTVTANTTAVTAPDGTTTADKLVETATTGSHSITQQITSVIGRVYTASVYAKAAERTIIAVRIDNLANSFTWFNLATGVIGTKQSGVTATITDAGGGWYRCSVTGTATATNHGPEVYIADADNSSSYAGDITKGVYLYGAQLEDNAPFATSYIPNGSAVAGATRTADVASVSTQAFPYSGTEGTLVAKGTFIAPADAGVSVMANLDNGSSGESINIYRQSNLVYLNIFDNSGPAQAQWAVSGTTNLSTAAIAYKLNDIGAAVNGSSQTPDTSATLPTVDRMNIGRMWGGSFGANGHIRQITYIPRRLSNSELQARTV